MRVLPPQAAAIVDPNRGGLSGFCVALQTWLDKFSLRAQLAVATALLCAVLILGASLIAAWIGRSKAAELIGATMAALAASMSERLDQNMFERYREIGIVADMEILRPHWLQNADALRITLDRMQQSFPDYAWIGFADRLGVVRAATRGMLEGQSVEKRDWYADAKAGPFVGDLHEALLLARLLGPRRDGEPFRFVDVAYPVRDPQGHLLGVLGAHLSWDWVSDLRNGLLAQQGDASIEILVLDRRGNVLLGPRFGQAAMPPEQAKLLMQSARGFSDDLQTAFDDDRDWLTGYAATAGHREYPGLGWIVLARQPQQQALQPVNHLAYSIMAIGMLFILIALALTWQLAGRMSNPLYRIAQEAAQIGQDGDAAAAKLPLVGGSREIAHLSQTLRSLLRRIGVAQAQLADAERLQARHMDESRKLTTDLAEWQQLANTDAMTGLLNRRAFLDLAAQQVAFSRRYGGGLGAVVADIDHFKSVNDTYGHAAGDAAIKAVADLLKQSARESDLVARFGGEEFVVLLMASDLDATAAYAERVRAALAAATLTLPDGQPLRLTISLGCSGLLPQDKDVQDTIDRADGALYAAKTAGRNRVMLAAAAANAAETDGQALRA